MKEPAGTVPDAKRLAQKVAAAKHLSVSQAKADLDFFCIRVQQGGLVVTKAGCEANLDRLRRILAAAYPSSEPTQARELVSIAELLEDHAGLVGAKSGGYRDFAKQLRLEADAMVATTSACPWESPDVLELLTPGEKTLSAALWRCNKHRDSSWTIPLEKFCREGWGDPDADIRTVRSSVSKLVKTLRGLDIDLTVSVHCSRTSRSVECQFNPKK